MNSLLLRTAARSRAAASASVRSSTSASSIRSASVLAGTASPFSSLPSPSPVATFRGAGFKIAAATSFTPQASFGGSAGGGFRRHLSTFLASYDGHVSDRAALAGGLGVAPQPLSAAQVAELIEEMRAAREGEDGADRVRFFFSEMAMAIHMPA